MSVKVRWLGLLVLACRPAEEPPKTPGPAATPADPVQVAVDTITQEDLARHIRTLASDAFAGRFPGTPGESKTLSYLASGFARAGVEPAVDGLFTQEVPLLEATTDPSATMKASSPQGAESFAWGEDFLVGTANGEPQIQLADRPVVFAGYGIVAPEHRWNDYAQVDVRDAVVLVIGGEPGAPGDDSFFEGRALTHHGTSSAKIEAAAKRGAAAVLLIRGEGEGGIPWSTLHAGALAPKYRLPPASGEPSVRAQGLLRERSAQAITTLAGEDLASLRRAAADQGFVARPLDVRLDLDLRTEVEDARSHNVVALLRGRTRPDEYVIYTAHWDHVGVREQLDGDNIFNGAVDNATGTAALLELAEAYAALPEPPGRSIVFLATTAEEQGLLGSFHYVAHPIFPLAQTVGVINMDALFPFGPFDSMTVVALGASELDEYLGRAAEAVGRSLHADPMPELGAFFRSDHYPFAVRGVPATFAVGGPSPQGPVDPEVAARFQDYLMHRYHQPADEFDSETWDLAGVRQDVEVYFRMGHALASTTDMPNWRADHAFRRERDAMLGER